MTLKRGEGLPRWLSYGPFAPGCMLRSQSSDWKHKPVFGAASQTPLSPSFTYVLSGSRWVKLSQTERWIIEGTGWFPSWKNMEAINDWECGCNKCQQVEERSSNSHLWYLALPILRNYYSPRLSSRPRVRLLLWWFSRGRHTCSRKHGALAAFVPQAAGGWTCRPLQCLGTFPGPPPGLQAGAVQAHGHTWVDVGERVMPAEAKLVSKFSKIEVCTRKDVNSDTGRSDVNH